MSLSNVDEFLASELGPWIGGSMIRSPGGSALDCVDPGTGEACASFAESSADDVAAAVENAVQAFQAGRWSRAEPAQRARVLRNFAQLAAERRKLLAQIECIDTGKTLSQALTDVTHFVQTLEYYADLADRTPLRRPLDHDVAEAYSYRAPAGVAAVIIPWNFPIVLLGWNIAPALAAGNSVVVKPAEQAVLSTLYLAQLALEAGLPAGILNVVPGDGTTAGAALASSPGIARMSFTGSPEAGRSVAAACARSLTPVKLELGGKGAAVVLPDADVSSTVKPLVKAITMNAGQVCCTATRWVIHRSLFDEFLDNASGRLQAVRVGYWSDLKSRMGPLISHEQRQRVLGFLDRAADDGCRSVCPGGPLEGAPGFFVRPALLTGPPAAEAAQREIFGPVAYALPFDDEDEAIALVNDCAYGLANSVWSADTDGARRLSERLESGTVWINTHNLLLPGIPYAGVNESGYGSGTLGEAAFFEQLRHTAISGLKTR